MAGVLWIALSDRAADLISDEPAVLARIQTLKGWVFVALTSVLVYALSRQSLATARRSAARAREGRRFLATLVSNLPGIVYRCLSDARRTMEFVSDGCRDLTGYDRADLMWNAKLAYGEVIHPDDRDAVRRDVMAALEAERPFRITYRIVAASGEEKWVWEQGRAVGSDPTGAFLDEAA